MRKLCLFYPNSLASKIFEIGLKLLLTNKNQIVKSERISSRIALYYSRRRYFHNQIFLKQIIPWIPKHRGFGCPGLGSMADLIFFTIRIDSKKYGLTA